MANTQIKHRFTGAVLFEFDVSDNIASGLRTRHALEKAVQSGAYLRGADLGGAYLRGAYLRDAYLRDADLRGAYLRGADLGDADLRGAYLRGADLGGADLGDAYLRGADLGGADLGDADLGDADLRGAYLRGADLGGADLRGADLGDADLRGAYLRGADLRDAYLRSAYLRGAYLRDADLRGADLGDADGEQLPRATPEQAIENLDKVRAIIMDNKSRLKMGHWHSDEGWKGRTCAEEAACETTHCMAGWLQVCSTELALKNIDPQLAGVLAAPVAAKMFYRGNKEAYDWLESRAYVAETEEAEKRAAERKAKRAAREQP